LPKALFPYIMLKENLTSEEKSVAQGKPKLVQMEEY
jgi:hypothetical protein